MENPDGKEKSEKTKSVFCKGCKAEFRSKNALFRHLRSQSGTCLSVEEHKDFLKHVVNRDANCEKIVVLYGYIPSDCYLDVGLKSFGAKPTVDYQNVRRGVCDGNHASELVLEAIKSVSHGGTLDSEEKANSNFLKANRSYGNSGRPSDAVSQDAYTGALTEVLTIKAPPLLLPEDSNLDMKAKESFAINEWSSLVNKVLAKMIAELAASHGIEMHKAGKVMVFSRLTAPKKFNAEMDYNQRRIDYVIPADMLFSDEKVTDGQTKKEFFDSMESFRPGFTLPYNDHISFVHLAKLKKVMQKFCTQVVELDTKDEAAVLAKEFHRKKRMKHGKGAKSQMRKDGSRKKDEKEIDMELLMGKKSKKGKKERVLKRRRFHNFTERVMCHEYLAYRRFDRFFHRATIRAVNDEASSSEKSKGRPYIVLSLKGDLFLCGQARSIIGLLIAICRGYIHEDILACVFDEDYTNLVPMPFAPTTGMIAAEAGYVSWEGKMKAILNPRDCKRYENGWNSDELMEKLDIFKTEIYECIMRSWNEGEQSFNSGSLPSTSRYYGEYMEKWAIRAKAQLEDYRNWKTQLNRSNMEGVSLVEKLLPPVSSISSEVPALFEKVLVLLRNADKGGAWPSTTPKRQLVMVSTSESADGTEKSNDSLSIARLKAKSNNFSASSAYNLKEGQGGASGSFSVGAMPGQCEPPKGNSLFPELMKAAFELEIALCPDREPSSTIAINRNAQFRPHVDNGAGAGQSRSLIVGLGTYTGGSLIVEGVEHDIRYKCIEFNGWTQRHWTNPFAGERYSLVWFTPKGCEGVHGIDIKV